MTLVKSPPAAESMPADSLSLKLQRRHTRRLKLFEPSLVRMATWQSFAMLDPRNMARNPVMFLVEVGWVLTTLIEIDESFTTWRQRHALMAHRMLGRQSGTAGSGYAYLDETAKRYKAFKDLFDLSTYLLPRAVLPQLPPSLQRRLAFRGDRAS